MPVPGKDLCPRLIWFVLSLSLSPSSSLAEMLSTAQALVAWACSILSSSHSIFLPLAQVSKMCVSKPFAVRFSPSASSSLSQSRARGSWHAWHAKVVSLASGLVADTVSQALQNPSNPATWRLKVRMSIFEAEQASAL